MFQACYCMGCLKRIFMTPRTEIALISLERAQCSANDMHQEKDDPMVSKNGNQRLNKIIRLMGYA